MMKGFVFVQHRVYREREREKREERVFNVASMVERME
jgi:hypothetical protein